MLWINIKRYQIQEANEDNFLLLASGFLLLKAQGNLSLLLYSDKKTNTKSKIFTII